MRVDLLVEDTVYHNFLQIPQSIRFQCCSRQLKWNQVVIQLKRSGRLLLTSLKLSFKYLLLRHQK